MSSKTTLISTILSILLIHSLCDEDLTETDAQDNSLPQYLRDDGVKRVATLTKANFDRTVKHSKLTVVLFYLTSKNQPESEKAWKSDEQVLEVSQLS